MCSNHNVTELMIFQESNDISYAAQHNDFYETTETSKTTQKPFFIDNIPQEIPYLVPNPSQEIASPKHSPAISVPIIAFLDPAKISNDKIDMPIAAVLSRQDGTLDHLENGRDEIQRNVQNYVDESWSIDPNNWRPISAPSQVNQSLAIFKTIFFKSFIF